MALTTIRRALKAFNFDFDSDQTVVLIAQTPDLRHYATGWSKVGLVRPVGLDDPVLDRWWDGAVNAPVCPRFIAWDGRGVYFPVHANGWTIVRRVLLDPNEYLGDNGWALPYFGAEEGRTV